MTSLKRVDKAVNRLIAALETERQRAREADSRAADLEKLLERFEANGVSPARLTERVAALEAENTELRTRLDQGREGVQRMLARVRFLEERP